MIQTPEQVLKEPMVPNAGPRVPCEACGGAGRFRCGFGHCNCQWCGGTRFAPPLPDSMEAPYKLPAMKGIPHG